MTMRSTRLFILSAILSMGLSAQGAGTRPWWITFGGGTATSDGLLQMSAGVVYGTKFESSVLSARILGATNQNPTVRKWEPTPTTYKLTDYGILYGPVWEFGDGMISAGAGVGLVRTTMIKGGAPDSRSSASIPLEVQALWRISNFFGAGVYGYTNFNGAHDFSGLLLTVQLGVFHRER
jgi:hypothetical protein